jgi:hypothetical protein
MTFLTAMWAFVAGAAPPTLGVRVLHSALRNLG